MPEKSYYGVDVLSVWERNNSSRDMRGKRLNLSTIDACWNCNNRIRHGKSAVSLGASFYRSETLKFSSSTLQLRPRAIKYCGARF